jgi:N-acetylglucosamine-6-sulfatase
MKRQLLVSSLAAVILVAASSVWGRGAGTAKPTVTQPNIVFILSDDQSIDSFPHDPAPMPYLQAQTQDVTQPWVNFTNAFLETPMCCPSRATILSGQYSHHDGVENNTEGDQFDESTSLATWLHDGGYYTGLAGKYLNGYPFDRGHYIPQGWDWWMGLEAGTAEALYYNYTLNENGVPVKYGSDPSDYQTDVLAGKAVDFINSAPATQPFFLYLAPSAPHTPWTAAPRYIGAFDGIAPTHNPDFNEKVVSDKPAWVQALPLLTRHDVRVRDYRRQQEYETLLAFDDAVRDVFTALQNRGALDNTVIIFMTDNGFSFGEHRWVGKACIYEECIRTPLYVRWGGAIRHDDSHLVSNVDIAETIAELAGVTPGRTEDGMSFAPLLTQTPTAWRTELLERWASGGGSDVPPYWGLRTANFAYSELESGEFELYDLTGAHGSPDPWELHNIAGDPAYAQIQARLAADLQKFKQSHGA